MAAPTPVSSLVHSRTLVTAGVYLLFRFGRALQGSLGPAACILVGSATMLLAGGRALWETDMKKIVALSTLSQLGLIVTRLGMGLYSFAFFHLLTHAYFKAMLFLRVGHMIHLSGSFQDIRQTGTLLQEFPVTSRYLLVANLRLCGTPFLAGFYSKDLILESGAFDRESPLLPVSLFSGALLTTAYTARRLRLTSWSPTRLKPLS